MTAVTRRSPAAPKGDAASTGAAVCDAGAAAAARKAARTTAPSQTAHAVPLPYMRPCLYPTCKLPAYNEGI